MFKYFEVVVAWWCNDEQCCFFHVQSLLLQQDAQCIQQKAQQHIFAIINVNQCTTAERFPICLQHEEQVARILALKNARNEPNKTPKQKMAFGDNFLDSEVHRILASMRFNIKHKVCNCLILPKSWAEFATSLNKTFYFDANCHPYPKFLLHQHKFLQ